MDMRLMKNQWIAHSAENKKLRYERVKRVLYSFIKQDFNTGAEPNSNSYPTQSPVKLIIISIGLQYKRDFEIKFELFDDTNTVPIGVQVVKTCTFITFAHSKQYFNFGYILYAHVYQWPLTYRSLFFEINQGVLNTVLNSLGESMSLFNIRSHIYSF